MDKISIVGASVISGAGKGQHAIFDAMEKEITAFAPDRQGEPRYYPMARIDEREIIWPDDDPWWSNNKKFASTSAIWAVNAARELQSTYCNLTKDERGRSAIIVAVGGTGEEELSRLMPRLLALSLTDERPLATLLYEEVPDYSYVRGIPSLSGQYVARITGFRASNVAVYGETNCGGIGALTLGARMLKTDEVDRVVVVGVAPPITPEGLSAVKRLEGLADKATKGSGPFDRGRAGALMGQGAAAILLERESVALNRGLEPLGTLGSVGVLTASSEKRALSSLLSEDTKVRHPDLWFSHATGSRYRDKDEYATVRSAYDVLVTSSKGTIGFVPECSGLIDIALALEAIRRLRAPPIGLLDVVDPAFCASDIVHGIGREVSRLNEVLVTALGFTGAHTAGVATINRWNG